MKKLLLGLVAVGVVCLGAVWLYVNEIVGTAIDRGATYALGVDTRVGFVRISPFTGDFHVSGLRIANPPGFDEPLFLRMGSADVNADISTLREPVIEIPTFGVKDVDVALEREGKQTNYGTILANLKRFQSEAAAGQPAQEGGSSRRFVIRKVAIRDVNARVEWSELASDQTGVTVVIPLIELSDVGAKGGKGVTMGELSSILTTAILGSIARYGGNLPGAVLSGLETGLGGVARVPGVVVTGAGKTLVDVAADAVGGEVGDAVRGVGGSAAKSVGGAVGEAGKKALGGLFGGGDDESR